MANESLVLPIEEGARIEFSRAVTTADIDAFARISGDTNPLHMDRDFAIAAGFRDRVVHGAFLSGLVSRLVGMELPTQRTVLLNMSLHFAAPTFPGDTLDVAAVVASVHPSAAAVTLKITVRCGEELRARGSAMVRVDPES